MIRTIDLAAGEISWRAVYKLCIGFVNPRPIALTSTIDAEGRTNLAPFSFYNMVSGNPPVVMICTALRRDRSRKDTLTNIEQTREFVIATVTTEIGRQMVDCAADLPAGQSEFAFSGLTPAPATRVRPPLVKESPVNIECTLRDVYRISDEPGGANLVFGDIVAIHIDEQILTPEGDAVDPHKLQTVGRLGGAYYCDVTKPYAMEIPPADRAPRAE